MSGEIDRQREGVKQYEYEKERETERWMGR